MSESAWSFVMFFALVGVTAWIVLSVRAKWRRDARGMAEDEHIPLGAAPPPVDAVDVRDPARDAARDRSR